MNCYLPKELVDYILYFNEEWKIVGGRFINLQKLLQIPFIKQTKGTGFFRSSIMLEIKRKCIALDYLLNINNDTQQIEETFAITSMWNKITRMIIYHCISKDRITWKYIM